MSIEMSIMSALSRLVRLLFGFQSESLSPIVPNHTSVPSAHDPSHPSDGDIPRFCSRSARCSAVPELALNFHDSFYNFSNEETCVGTTFNYDFSECNYSESDCSSTTNNDSSGQANQHRLFLQSTSSPPPPPDVIFRRG